MNVFYIQIDKNGIVRDCLHTFRPGYILIRADEPLPIGLTGGWFKYVDGEFIEIPELNPNNLDTIKQKAKDELIVELIMMGAL